VAKLFRQGSQTFHLIRCHVELRSANELDESGQNRTRNI
jgi:hypothetical protein